MNWIRCWAVPALVAGLWVGAPADAQDMSFDLEETGQSQAPVKLGKPSKRLSEALNAFEAKRYEEAAMKFERVVAGKSRDGRGNRNKAQYMLGQTLYNMGYYQSSLTVFDDISAQGPRHMFFGETLEWLGLLASKLPESSGIIEKVGRYGFVLPDAFDADDVRDQRPTHGVLRGPHGAIDQGAERDLPQRRRGREYQRVQERRDEEAFVDFVVADAREQHLPETARGHRHDVDGQEIQEPVHEIVIHTRRVGFHRAPVGNESRPQAPHKIFLGRAIQLQGQQSGMMPNQLCKD